MSDHNGMKKWTTKDIETIFNMRKWNRNFQYIANYFNVTANAVRKAIQRRYNKNHYYDQNKLVNNNSIHHILLNCNNMCFLNIIKENKIRIRHGLPMLRVL